MAIASDAKRGTSASIDYNETPKTILVGFGFGTIDIQPTDNEWNSGEEIPVVLVDTDANLNSRVDEDLDLFNPDVPLIPALSTGTPFTVGKNTTAAVRAIFFNDTTFTFKGDITNTVGGVVKRILSNATEISTKHGNAG